MSYLDFWTPVKYGTQPTTLLQKVTELVDSYFYLGGRVASVISKEDIILGSGRAKWWQTGLKVISYGAVFINLFATALYPGLKQFRSIVYLQTLLNCLPVVMLVMKVILRWISQFEIKRLQAFPELPSDLNLEIFKFLDLVSLAQASIVCKKWKALASTESLWKGHDLTRLFPKLSVIDKNVWETHVDLKAYGLSCESEGDQRKVIQGLHQMFKSLQIENDAGITLLTMPQGLTFDQLENLAASPRLGNTMPTSFISCDFFKYLPDDPIKKTYQIAITNDILKNSKTLSMNKQQNLVQILKYDMPQVLEVSTLAILTYIRSQPSRYLYGYSPMTPTNQIIYPPPVTFTQCSRTEEVGYRVGGFKQNGILVFYFHSRTFNETRNETGVAAVRRFAPDSASLGG